MTPIGEQIREAREKAGMTQVELAERLLLPVWTIEAMETGTSMLERIAAALDCDLEITLKPKARG